jgi:DNA-binding NtrC family response regulator
MWRAINSLFDSVGTFLRRLLSKYSAETSPLANGSAFPTISVIALGVNDPDRNLLIEASVQHKWKMQFSVTCGDAWSVLEQTKAPIILCDRDIEGAEWRDVVKMMASSTHGACAILLSRVVDDYLWNEVIANGGYDVVPKPLREEDVVRSVRLAWSYWSSSTRPSPLPVKH